jgi:hypothetical protein
MKTFVATLGTAGVIAFAALNLAAAASAAPAQSYQPTGNLIALHAPFVEGGGSGADRMEDRYRERVQRDRLGLSVPGVEFDSPGKLPLLAGIGQHPSMAGIGR